MAPEEENDGTWSGRPKAPQVGTGNADQQRPASYERIRGGGGEATRHVCVMGVSERDDEALRESSLSFGNVLSIERNTKVTRVAATNHAGADDGVPNLNVAYSSRLNSIVDVFVVSNRGECQYTTKSSFIVVFLPVSICLVAQKLFAFTRTSAALLARQLSAYSSNHVCQSQHPNLLLLLRLNGGYTCTESRHSGDYVRRCDRRDGFPSIPRDRPRPSVGTDGSGPLLRSDSSKGNFALCKRNEPFDYPQVFLEI